VGKAHYIEVYSKLHETGKCVQVFETGTDTKRDPPPPKFWKRGNAIYIYIYISSTAFRELRPLLQPCEAKGIGSIEETHVQPTKWFHLPLKLEPLRIF